LTCSLSGSECRKAIYIPSCDQCGSIFTPAVSVIEKIFGSSCPKDAVYTCGPLAVNWVKATKAGKSFRKSWAGVLEAVAVGTLVEVGWGELVKVGLGVKVGVRDGMAEGVSVEVWTGTNVVPFPAQADNPRLARKKIRKQ
jgi:hypothetical protein